MTLSMNQGWTYTDRLRSAHAGQTVLDYYTQHYPHSTCEKWQLRIEQAHILLDGHPVTPDTVLTQGQKLTYYRQPWQEPEAPLAFEVLYEDEDLWAIAKPSGLPVLPGGGFLEHTLLHQMRSRYPQQTPVPVHRLGRGTSGVILIAKSQQARKALSQQFRVRTAQSIAPIKNNQSASQFDHQATAQSASPVAKSQTPGHQAMGKIYRALIGPTDPSQLSDQFACHYPIGKLPYPGLAYLYGHVSNGLVSRSDCQVLQRRSDSTLVQVSIATGRPHQIRIHLAAAGYPLLGDPLYARGGIPIAGGSAMPGDGGYHLHAHTISFSHPSTGKTLCIEAKPPELLQLIQGDTPFSKGCS